MANMTDTAQVAKFINYMFANAGSITTTITTPLKLRLMTAMGSSPANQSGHNGTELSTATGYTTGGSALSASNAAAFGTFSGTSPAAVTNINAVSWSVGSSWSTVVGVEIWDSTGTPVRMAQGTLTSNITGATNGDTVQFASGAISLDATSW
jgi:hypothetical protein